MKKSTRPVVTAGAGLLLVSALLALPLAAASIQGAKPEDVGLSSDRLQRIHEAMERHIQAGDLREGSPWSRARAAWRTSKHTA